MDELQAVRVAEYTKILYESAAAAEIELEKSRSSSFDFHDAEGAYNTARAALDMPVKLDIPRNMPVTGQNLVILGYNLDRLSIGLALEDPMGWATSKAMSLLDEDGEMYLVLRTSTQKLKKAFKAHIEETCAVRVDKRLFSKKASSPLALSFARLDGAGRPVALIAMGVYKEAGSKLVDLSVMDRQLKEAKLYTEIFAYFTYQLADTIRRIQNHRLPYKTVLLYLPQDAVNSVKVAEPFAKLITEYGILPTEIGLAVDPETIKKHNKTYETVIKRVRDLGCPVIELDFASLNGSNLISQGDSSDKKPKVKTPSMYKMEDDIIEEIKLAYGLLEYPHIDNQEEYLGTTRPSDE